MKQVQLESHRWFLRQYKVPAGILMMIMDLKVTGVPKEQLQKHTSSTKVGAYHEHTFRES